MLHSLSRASRAQSLVPQKSKMSSGREDPRRSNRIYRYKPSANKPGDDPTADYLNLMGMIFSMCGLMMRVSICWSFFYSLFFLMNKSFMTLFALCVPSWDVERIVQRFALNILQLEFEYMVHFKAFAAVHQIDLCSKRQQPWWIRQGAVDFRYSNFLAAFGR